MEAATRACHELRGPITAARLGLQLGAGSSGLSPDRLRAIELELGRAALALDDLNHAGSTCRVLRGRGPIDVAELLADSIEAARVEAAHRRVRLELTWSGGPATVWGDRLRLAQATRNLIANAIEHGGEPVEVRGRVNGTSVRIEVTDGGPGLPTALPELTRRAQGGRGSRGRGLAIAVAAAEDHGGRLASAPSERGARLVLELPVAPPENAVG